MNIHIYIYFIKINYIILFYLLEKVYVTGFSNGAMMSESLGCLMSSKFRAVASVSGVVELNKTAADSLTTCDDNIK